MRMLLVISLVIVVVSLLGLSIFSSRGGALAKDEPPQIYSTDAHDPWNRIFCHLLTRTIQVRVTDAFPERGPFTAHQLMGGKRSVSTRSFEHIEGGDRAIEALHPQFFQLPRGFDSLIRGSRFIGLDRALQEALADTKERPPLHRMLMQSDAWAAFDVVSDAPNRFFRDDPESARRCEQLSSKLARFIRKLALTTAEIEALPDNYAAAAKKLGLPDLFNVQSGWMEIEWLKERIHDQAADFRRVTRVFFKPSSPPADKAAFLQSLRHGRLMSGNGKLDAVGLLVQLLAIDTKGKIVPTRLTYEAQFRRFGQSETDRSRATSLKAYELSRQLLVRERASSGLVFFNDEQPAFLPGAGNDYAFASPILSGNDANRYEHPVLGSMRQRCSACHGGNGGVILSLSVHDPESQPPIKMLKTQDRARYVAEQKQKREDFKTLQKLMKSL